jgi:hypothetical protein
MEPLHTTEYSVLPGFSHREGKPRYFDQRGPRSSAGSGVDLTFIPVYGEPWFATFSAGLTRYTQVLPTPSGEHCCVVVDGQAYLIDVRRPDSAKPISKGDVIAGIVPEAERLLVLVSPVDIIGVLSEGRWWRSDRLASDELRNVAVSDGVITGEGWQAAGNRWVEFKIDAQTGRVKT